MFFKGIRGCAFTQACSDIVLIERNQRNWLQDFRRGGKCGKRKIRLKKFGLKEGGALIRSFWERHGTTNHGFISQIGSDNVLAAQTPVQSTPRWLSVSDGSQVSIPAGSYPGKHLFAPWVTTSRLTSVQNTRSSLMDFKIELFCQREKELWLCGQDEDKCSWQSCCKLLEHSWAAHLQWLHDYGLLIHFSFYLCCLLAATDNVDPVI